MSQGCDILLSGTGAFAARIAFDMAAIAGKPVRCVIAGRNRERLSWLVTAANARAKIFGTPARFAEFGVDLLAKGAAAEMLGATAPRLVVQAASVQTSAVIARTDDAWSALVRDGGLSATAVAQALISSRVAAATAAAGGDIRFVNCSFPDVVNGLIAAMGYPVLCGIGNVAILSSVFAGARDLDPSRIKILAHYQNLAPFRLPREGRTGRPPRVWIDGREIEGVFEAFSDVKLTPEPVIDVSGASGAPLFLALSSGDDWTGHVPGPHGLPGGYPVRLSGGALELHLPAGLSRDDAIAWNGSFEAEKGLVVDRQGRAAYTGRLRDLLAIHSPDLAKGFDVRDIEDVYLEMQRLRARLEATS